MYIFAGELTYSPIQVFNCPRLHPRLTLSHFVHALSPYSHAVLARARREAHDENLPSLLHSLHDGRSVEQRNLRLRHSVQAAILSINLMEPDARWAVESSVIVPVLARVLLRFKQGFESHASVVDMEK
jgi:hypothetical protein